jgi:hypothetical protein
MSQIPATAQAWADVHPYGRVFLRKYSSFAMIKIYSCVQSAATAAIPHLLEYYHFMAPLSDEQLMARLNLMGYPENLYVAGLAELSPAGQTFIAVTEYGGQALIPVIMKLKDAGQTNELKVLMRSLGVCFGTLHRAGLICDDTHPDQFVADEALAVRRIDVHQSRVRMDIVSGHPIFGGINERYFEHRRLTPSGFDAGVRAELQGANSLAKHLDTEVFSRNDATQHCREGYLSAGGTSEAWTSGEVSLMEAKTPPLH